MTMAAMQTTIPGTDYWRGSPARLGGRSGHKEWSYFCIFSENLELLINFSLSDPPPQSREAQAGVPRLILLANVAGDGWTGSLNQYSSGEVSVLPGTVNAEFGNNKLAYEDSAYNLLLDNEYGEIGASIRLTPCMQPAIASSVRLSSDGAMRWLVIPRLLADGEVSVRGTRYQLRGALAYHDRNWGHFMWGGNFAWEWATILPVDADIPWSLVYMRISDQSRNQTLSQGLIAWHRDAPSRTFHGRNMNVTQRGLQRPRDLFRLPAVSGIASPGMSADIPRDIHIDARSGADSISLLVELNDMAQIGIPNDADAGLTLLSECSGAAQVTGSVQGRQFDFGSRVLAEFNHAG